MSESARRLPPRAWTCVYKAGGMLLLAAAAISIALTSLCMTLFSTGPTLPGMLIAVLLPMILGGPTLFCFNHLYRLTDQRLYQAKTDGLDHVALMQAA